MIVTLDNYLLFVVRDVCIVIVAVDNYSLSVVCECNTGQLSTVCGS